MEPVLRQVGISGTLKELNFSGYKSRKYGMATQLNLARKWRSKQFDQVIGQDLSIRMLQNSLYLDQIFPVYLFSGQRGCGKTTTARIFAAALNCAELDAFRKDPKSHKIPCLNCESCKAIAAGSHPDFIEIDAASHTGVDNVRQIIDAASLLPVMGTKRLYLIDEAHMLSKAAFNAFLKILEEPPASVVFMLATTDPQKIIETVRSRCFQLFFPAISLEPLLKHLQAVCTAENIRVEENALKTIIQETEGSARDALNLLEQVRFSHAKVSKDAVLRVLGHVPEPILLDLFTQIIAGDPGQLLVFLQEKKVNSYTPLAVWQKLQEVIRNILYVKYGVARQVTIEDKERVAAFARKCSLEQLTGWLQKVYSTEMLLLKTTAQQGVLDMMLLGMCGTENATEPVVAVTVQKKTVPPKPVTVAPVSSKQDNRWSGFVVKVEQMSEPLLNSIFKQAQFKSYDEQTNELVVAFAKDTTFFGDWLKETKSTWMGFLQESFGPDVQFKPVFEKSAAPKPVVEKNSRSFDTIPNGTTQDDFKKGSVSSSAGKVIAKPQAAGSPNKFVRPKIKKTIVVNVTDKDKWKTANKLVDAFGGTVVEVEGEHEKA
ncbi:MAG: DNA polymerase III subunit gamma/tau [Alteromonas naphthalenivorans]